MEKAYIIAQAKLQAWKISTHNMCEKAQSRAKPRTNAKNL